MAPLSFCCYSDFGESPVFVFGGVSAFGFGPLAGLGPRLTGLGPRFSPAGLGPPSGLGPLLSGLGPRLSGRLSLPPLRRSPLR